MVRRKLDPRLGRGLLSRVPRTSLSVSRLFTPSSSGRRVSAVRFRSPSARSLCPDFVFSGDALELCSVSCFTVESAGGDVLARLFMPDGRCAWDLTAPPATFSLPGLVLSVVSVGLDLVESIKAPWSALMSDNEETPSSQKGKSGSPPAAHRTNSMERSYLIMLGKSLPETCATHVFLPYPVGILLCPRGHCHTIFHSYVPMADRTPYKGRERKLVIALDVGTTFSGVSYRCVVLDRSRIIGLII